jgi:hypothetical protein
MTKVSYTRIHSPKIISLVIAAAVACTLILSNSHKSHAAPTPPSLYLNPAAQTVAPNTAFTVEVHENSGTANINVVQANLSYNAANLTLNSIDYSTSAFSLQAQNTSSNGNILIARGQPGGLTGDQIIAVLHFTSNTAASTTVNFASGSMLVESVNNTNILPSLTSTAGDNVTVSNSSGNLTIGEKNILPQTDSGNGSLLVAQSAGLAQSATVQSLSFYVSSAAGKLRLGIYDASGPSGGPGAKKAETAEITPVTGWNTANVITPVSLPAGTYWLAYLPSDDNLTFAKGQDASSSGFSCSVTYGALLANFCSPAAATTSHWSLYANLSLVSTGPKQGDINGDNSVNITDLSLLLSSYGQSTTQCVTNNAYKCDLSTPGDNIINIFDLSILLSHYGT